MNLILYSHAVSSHGTGLLPTVGAFLSHKVLAQAAPTVETVLDWEPIADFIPVGISLVGAIAILLLGWIVAAIVATVIRNLLKRSQVDNRLASWTTGQAGLAANLEGWVATLVFWVIMILAIVAALDTLKLTTVSEPLNNFLNQIFAYLPKLGGAAILVAVAWVLATITKLVVVRMAQQLGLDNRLTDTASPDGAPESEAGRFLLSETLGNALYWFIFLFFLPLILGALDLQGPLEPVQAMLTDFLAALPKLVKAVLIGGIGWLIARVVRGIVTNLLTAVGADQMGAKLGLSQTRGQQSLSWLVGTVVYVLILLPTSIAALEALELQAISTPAVAMLNQILTAIPQIFTAALILAIAYAIGQFIADLVTNLLTGIGFNNVFTWLGLPTPTATATSTTTSTDDSPAAPTTRTPSQIVGVITLVGVMLFSAVAATKVLGFQELTQLVSGLLVILGRVLVGVVVFAIGLYLANLAFAVISSSGTAQSRMVGQTARISIIALVAAMALQQMGIATSIVNLAFGLLLGAIAVAIALAFGLGGRDVAAEQLREWIAMFKRN